MSKNTNISELINYLSYDGSGNIVFNTVSSATTNTDKFLVSDTGVLKFRTAAQLLSDIGAQASGSYQTALSGTGFVKISGSTISYDNSTYATETYVGTAVSNLVGAAPSTLDTLNELATALGNDANFATTIATSIGTKQPQLNGTGFVKISGTTISYDSSTYLTTATASSTYLPLAGGTLTGNLTLSSSSSTTDLGGVLIVRGNGSAYSTHYLNTGAANVAKYIQYDASGNAINQINAGGVSYITGGYFGININTAYSPLTVKGSNISWGETVTYYPSPNGYITLAFRLEGADVTTGTWAIGKQSTADSGGVQYLQIAKNGLTGSALHRVDAVQTWDPANGNSCFGFKVGIGTTTPSDTLQVVGSSRWGTSTNNVVSYADGGGVYMELVGTNSNQKQLRIQGINNANNRYSSIRLEAGIEEIAFNTADLERMRIRSSGAVTRPYQPAFLAYNTSGFTVTGGGWYNISNAITTEAYDIGSNYSGGVFTAPVTGRYLFYAGGWSATGGNGERYAWCARANTTGLLYISGGNYSLADTPLAGYTIVHNLSAGDTVEMWVFSGITATWGGGSHAVWWGGYLL